MKRFARTALCALSVVLGSCNPEHLLGPGLAPPYLAIVVLTDIAGSRAAEGPYEFHLTELSGVLKVDTTFRATTRDTTILSVQAAEYHVDIKGIPASCGIRGGTRAYANVLPNTNTTIVRFYLTCKNALTLSVLTFGTNPDTSYAYFLTGPAGVTRSGLISGNDTTLVDNLASGKWDIELRLVQPNCVVVSPGGERATVTLSDTGGASHFFQVRCSNESRRPRIVAFRGSYQAGAVAFYAEIEDKDRDMDNFTYNITNCRGQTVLSNGGYYIYGLAGSANVSYADTARIVAGFDVDFTFEQLGQLCQSLWVGDQLGNVTPILEIPLVPRSTTKSPVATRFNAVSTGTTSLRVDLKVQDPDNDYVGAFVTYLLRDGTVAFPLDGALDLLVFQPAGILGTDIPEIPYNVGYGVWSDYFGVRVFLIDRQGNMTRLEDRELFR